jgi:opioid growth factor receptor-like protein
MAAPVLNRESIEEFRARPDLQEKLLFSFTRMMNFYGLEVRSGERVTITRAPNFAAKATVWLSPGNHNHLRITRILRCLTVLGLEPEAGALELARTGHMGALNSLPFEPANSGGNLLFQCARTSFVNRR